MKNKFYLDDLNDKLKILEKMLQKSEKDAIILLLKNKIQIDINRKLTKKEIQYVYNFIEKEVKIIDFIFELKYIYSKNYKQKGIITSLIFSI